MYGHDRPLTWRERLLVGIACVVFTPFVLVLLWLVWRDVQPAKARDVFEIGRRLVGVVLAVLILSFLWALLGTLLT